MKFEELYNILETNILTYIKSGLTPINNIFTILFKYSIPQDKGKFKINSNIKLM
jgi:hypothetical protein